MKIIPARDLAAVFSRNTAFVVALFASPFLCRIVLWREIVKILTLGVAIGEQVFRFIGHSNSQMKSKSCWLYKGSLEENENILDTVGFFKSIPSAAKRAKRVGLLFTNITFSMDVSEKFREELDEDIERTLGPGFSGASNKKEIACCICRCPD